MTAVHSAVSILSLPAAIDHAISGRKLLNVHSKRVEGVHYTHLGEELASSDAVQRGRGMPDVIK